jgi:rhamnulokinase
VAEWDGARFRLRELHRFDNGPVWVLGRMHWDTLALWREIQAGMSRYAAQYAAPPAGIGVDTWGVDYGLLDSSGRLLGNPVHYRDARTDGMVERVFRVVPKAQVFGATGIQFMQLNTLFQLYSMRVLGDPQLDHAAALLLTPDLFNYWLSGERAAEYTIASTTQMLLAHARDWDRELLAKLELPTHILQPIVQPGTVMGQLNPQVAAETGIAPGGGVAVPIVATSSHDTASAVAAIPGLDEHGVYLSSGTWSLMGVEIREPIIDSLTLQYNFTNEGGVGGTIRFLKNITGLWLLQQARRQWEREGHSYSWEQLLAEAKQAKPFQSLVNSDEAEFINPPAMVDAIRAYCRRTRQPEPQTVGEVTRCCLESLALRYRWVVEALERLLVTVDGKPGPELTAIRIVGGGSQNQMLNQLAADATGRVVVTGPVEAAALGNAMMQAVATGHLASVAEGRAAIAASIQQEYYEPKPIPGWDDAYIRFLRLIS